MSVFAALMIIFFIRIPLFTTLKSYIQLILRRWHDGTADSPIQLPKAFYLNLILFSISPPAIILNSGYIATSMTFLLSTLCSSLSSICNLAYHHHLSFTRRIMSFFLIFCTSLSGNWWNIILISITHSSFLLFLYSQYLYLLLIYLLTVIIWSKILHFLKFHSGPLGFQKNSMQITRYLLISISIFNFQPLIINFLNWKLLNYPSSSSQLCSQSNFDIWSDCYDSLISIPGSFLNSLSDYLLSNWSIFRCSCSVWYSLLLKCLILFHFIFLMLFVTACLVFSSEAWQQTFAFFHNNLKKRDYP